MTGNDNLLLFLRGTNSQERTHNVSVCPPTTMGQSQIPHTLFSRLSLFSVHFVWSCIKNQSRPCFGLPRVDKTVRKNVCAARTYSHCLATYGSVEVGRRLVVRVRQHRDDADHDSLNRMDGEPALRSLFIAILVLARWVKNRDAHVPVLCNWNVMPLSLRTRFF